jgi:hypothetical protein
MILLFGIKVENKGINLNPKINRNLIKVDSLAKFLVLDYQHQLTTIKTTKKN